MNLRFRMAVVACMGLACCLLSATSSGQSPAQSPGFRDVGELEKWVLPGAESKRRTHGAVSASDYLVDQPFEDVWRFYAKKLGSELDYKPNLTSGEGRNGSQVQILNSASERTGVRSATLIRHDKKNTIIVHISRGKDEEKTCLTLVVQSR